MKTIDQQLPKNLLKFEVSGTKVYIPEERYGIDLSLTENPLKFSPNILSVIEQEKGNINHYPDPYHHALRKELGIRLLVEPEQIIIGAGADGLIENIVRILITPGEQVILPDLTFLNAAFATIIAGGEPVFSTMMSDLHIDFEDIKRKITKLTKMIFLCNPNNPTGLIEPYDKILDLVKNTNVLVVVDEANIEFGGQSMVESVSKFSNLIVIRTFSKAYGLAGMRIGYCIGNKELLYYIWRLRPHLLLLILQKK